MEKSCKDCWHNYHCPVCSEGYEGFNPQTCPYNPDNEKKNSSSYIVTNERGVKQFKAALTKQDMMDRISYEYDQWFDKEEENYQSGRGYTGPSADLVEFSTEDLFNELMVRYRYNYRQGK